METSNRELQAAEYLERHRIKELVSYLTSALLFFRPGKGPHAPLQPSLHAGLIGKVTGPEIFNISIGTTELKVTGVAFPFFMDNSNIVAMFEMMDPSGRGTISFVPKTLGLSF
uniref:Uncharacterized protein n=1 Tax=Macaca nemestrina TaxID=9545 RepID=A0A2K6B7G8_MACNE